MKDLVGTLSRTFLYFSPVAKVTSPTVNKCIDVALQTRIENMPVTVETRTKDGGSRKLPLDDVVHEHLWYDALANGSQSQNEEIRASLILLLFYFYLVVLYSHHHTISPIRIDRQQSSHSLFPFPDKCAPIDYLYINIAICLFWDHSKHSSSDTILLQQTSRMRKLSEEIRQHYRPIWTVAMRIETSNCFGYFWCYPYGKTLSSISFFI